MAKIAADDIDANNPKRKVDKSVIEMVGCKAKQYAGLRRVGIGRGVKVEEGGEKERAKI